MKIAENENVNFFILEAAAILHDLGRFLDDSNDIHEYKSAEKAKEIAEQRISFTKAFLDELKKEI